MGPPPRSLRILLAACAVAAALLPWAGGRAGASTAVDAARARLADLEGRIASERSALADVRARLDADRASLGRWQARLAALGTEIEAAARSFGDTEAVLAQARDELDTARASLGSVRDRLDEQARQAYMFGPALGLEAVLGASSLADLSDRLEFVDTVSRSQAALSADVERQAVTSADRERRLEAVLSARASALRGLRARRGDLAAAFAAQQDLLRADRRRSARAESLLGELDRQRRAVEALVTRLATGLSPAELAAARTASAAAAAAHDGRTSPMPIGFGRWAALLMPRLGAPACTNNLIVVVAWETQEFTEARWNPLATTKDMPGATDFNSTGVKDYRTLGQGLEATRLTLEGGAPSWGYDAVLDSLRSCADPMATALAVNASAWCRGCEGGAYLTALVPAVEAWFSSHPS